MIADCGSYIVTTYKASRATWRERKEKRENRETKERKVNKQKRSLLLTIRSTLSQLNKSIIESKYT